MYFRTRIVIGAALIAGLLIPQGHSKMEAAEQPCVFPDAFPKSFYPHSVREYIQDDAFPYRVYRGRTFQLSQQYPTAISYYASDFPWLSIDFRDPRYYQEYLRTVLSTAYRDNLPNDWYLTNSPRSKWFHAPWMHWKQSSSYKVAAQPIYVGREFIHGLTYELPSPPQKLSLKQKLTRQNWAVSLYNAQGAVTLGRVWNKVCRGMVPTQQDCLFAQGTVAIKLLFTEADTCDLPDLRDAPTWMAHIFRETIPAQAALNIPYAVKPMSVDGRKFSAFQRTLKPLRLLQIDVAVRDNASPFGWVFGTFVYSNPLNGRNRRFTGVARGSQANWDNVMPVGLTWGNDPGVYFGSGKSLHQLIRNPAVRPFRGWGGRLNGPVDNPQSSCFSCHGTAVTQRIPNNAFVKDFPEFTAYKDKPEPLIPLPIRQKVTATFFRNLPYGKPFLRGKTSTDFSLQLTEGIHNRETVNDAIYGSGHSLFLREPNRVPSESLMSPRDGRD